ncbi:MAG: hypothetical protein AB7F35_10440 [Acetobacteraceae bacterium]
MARSSSAYTLTGLKGNFPGKGSYDPYEHTLRPTDQTAPVKGKDPRTKINKSGPSLFKHKDDPAEWSLPAEAEAEEAATRRRFAFLPVKLWRLENGVRAPAGRSVWLRRVTEVQTAWGEWWAWEHMQEG